MDPHDRSRFCRHQNEALGFMLFCHWVDNIQSGFRDWGQSTWTVIFGKVPKLRVTILAVTFFCSDLRVRTPASTNAWILFLRTKHLLMGYVTLFCGRGSSWGCSYAPFLLITGLQVTWACYPCWVGGRWSPPVHIWKNIVSVETWTPDCYWRRSFLLW